MKATTLFAALMASTLAVVPAFAQSDAQHDSHHPQQQSAPAPAQGTPPAASPGRSDTHGMGMMEMMGGTDMPGMMRMMSRMHAGMGDCMSDVALDHIEGRIAFLRTELRIADAQNAVWTTFAEVLRTQAQKLAQPTGAMMNQGGMLDRIDRQERGLSARLDSVRALKAAFAPLYTALPDEQKKAADALVGPYFGLPEMGMTGMMDGGMMQGGMKPGSAMPMSGMGR